MLGKAHARSGIGQALFVALLLFAVPSGADTSFHFEGHSYLIVTGAPRSWAAAQSDAQSRSVKEQAGYLAIVNSQAENDAIFAMLLAEGEEKFPRATDGGNARYAWLGGTDESADVAAASEGEFYWVDQTQFWTGGMGGAKASEETFVHWGFSNQEPDNFPLGNGATQSQGHVGMALEPWPAGVGVLGVGGEWNDIRGTSALGYVVEFNAVLTLMGDANNDSLVTGADLIAVQQNFGRTEEPPASGTLPGDANDDGLVTGADLISVQQNFGKTLASVTEPVPEPAAWVALGSVVVALRRHHRRTEGTVTVFRRAEKW